MARKLNIVEVDLGKRGDVNVTIEDFDCTGEQPMYNPLGGSSKSLMFAASAIKYKMQYEELNAELATLRAENKTMRRELMAIQSLYEEGTIAHHRAKEALK